MNYKGNILLDFVPTVWYFFFFLFSFFSFRFFNETSVDTEMCCPKGKCGCQYFILLTLKKNNHGHKDPGIS